MWALKNDSTIQDNNKKKKKSNNQKMPANQYNNIKYVLLYLHTLPILCMYNWKIKAKWLLFKFNKKTKQNKSHLQLLLSYSTIFYVEYLYPMQTTIVYQ